MLRTLAITAAFGITLTLLADLRSQGGQRDETMRLAQSTIVSPSPRQTAETEPPKKDGPQLPPAPDLPAPKIGERVAQAPAKAPKEKDRPSPQTREPLVKDPPRPDAKSEEQIIPKQQRDKR